MLLVQSQMEPPRNARIAQHSKVRKQIKHAKFGVFLIHPNIHKCNNINMLKRSYLIIFQIS